MTCPSALTQSMYIDGELAPDDALRLEQHVAACATCSARIAMLRDESVVLRSALRHGEDEVPIPNFAPPARARDLLALVIGVSIVGAFGNAFWNDAVAAVPSGLRWLNPLQSGELFERAFNVLTFIAYEGTAMWTATLNIIGAVLVVALFGWIALSTARRHGSAAIAASLLAVVIALPSIGHAFERRSATGVVTVAVDETIDDTLLATADTVVIDGNVNGDLLAFGRSVTVRGNVAGDLITGGESVMIEGAIGGSVIGGGRGVSHARARVGRNLFGFGRDVSVDAASEVVGNVIGGGETVDIDGRVGTDLVGLGDTLRLSGNVQGDVIGFADQITLLPSARVGGNITAHVDNANDLSIATGAVVGGTVDTQIREREQRRDPYATVGFYVRQIVRLGTMFVVGFLLLALFPTLREISLPTVGAVLRSGAIGLAAAVTLPVAAVLVCFTVIGIPIGVLTFILGAIGLYLSKILLAQSIGRGVIRSAETPPHYAMSLLAGLAIVVVAINLPWIGGLANFLLTIVGFGVVVTLLLARFQRKPTAG